MPELSDYEWYTHFRQECCYGQPALVIAEAAQADDGSLGMAHAVIDAAAAAAAEAIKFQIHLADAESTLNEPFRVIPRLTSKTCCG